jgi:hypothetical protein
MVLKPFGVHCLAAQLPMPAHVSKYPTDTHYSHLSHTHTPTHQTADMSGKRAKNKEAAASGDALTRIAIVDAVSVCVRLCLHNHLHTPFLHTIRPVFTRACTPRRVAVVGSSSVIETHVRTGRSGNGGRRPCARNPAAAHSRNQSCTFCVRHSSRTCTQRTHTFARTLLAAAVIDELNFVRNTRCMTKQFL